MMTRRRIRRQRIKTRSKSCHGKFTGHTADGGRIAHVPKIRSVDASRRSSFIAGMEPLGRRRMAVARPGSRKTSPINRVSSPRPSFGAWLCCRACSAVVRPRHSEVECAGELYLDVLPAALAVSGAER